MQQNYYYTIDKNNAKSTFYVAVCFFEPKWVFLSKKDYFCSKINSFEVISLESF